MKCKIACVGKLKDACYEDACAELVKRLSRYYPAEIAEVSDEKAPDSLSPAEETRVRDREGERLLARIRDGEYVIALAIGGQQADSVSFARKLSALAGGGTRTVTFVIGGSLGLSDAVLARADEQLSLSRMTFPHRIARLLILEQVYRAAKINAGETYHK